MLSVATHGLRLSSLPHWMAVVLDLLLASTNRSGSLWLLDEWANADDLVFVKEIKKRKGSAKNITFHWKLKMECAYRSHLRKQSSVINCLSMVCSLLLFNSNDYDYYEAYNRN